MRNMPQDARMTEIKHAMSSQEERLEALERYLNRLPADERKAARESLQIAVEMGTAFGKIEHVPLHPPMTEDGTLQLGPELRRHLREVREVYHGIHQLRDRVGIVLQTDTAALLHDPSRDPRTVRSDSSSGIYPIAA